MKSFAKENDPEDARMAAFPHGIGTLAPVRDDSSTYIIPMNFQHLDVLELWKSILPATPGGSQPWISIRVSKAIQMTFDFLRDEDCQAKQLQLERSICQNLRNFVSVRSLHFDAFCTFASLKPSNLSPITS